MSVSTININKFQQNFEKTLNKEKYGEVNTDFELIIKMLDLIPSNYYKNPKLKWLDPCCGHGYFMIVLFHRLNYSLKDVIPNENSRSNHIIENMLYMVEINPNHVPKLEELFGKSANIYNEDFLDFKKDMQFDIIVGNPPFNSGGKKKVPTDKKSQKKNDGKTIWTSFVKQSISLLKQSGLLVMITPSIWMRPDKAKMYDFLTRFNIKKIHCLSNTETNKVFHGKAQTPTCYFLLTNKIYATYHYVTLYDSQTNRLYPWHFYRKNLPIPVFAASILFKLQWLVQKYGHLNVIKTNMPNKNAHYSPKKTFITQFPNVKTCLLDKNQPYLKINYTNMPIQFNGKPKLIMAHKMYGFPFLDEKGKYGISNRDTYLILNKPVGQLLLLRDFLSTRFARYIFEGSRYRMKYLGKTIFELIPDITKIYKCNVKITDSIIADIFHLNKKDREIIMNFHKKNYLFCIEDRKIENKIIPTIKVS